MDEIERYYINIYHTLDPEFGYNFEGRGNKNKILSEETLKKRSKSISGRRHPFYGKFNEEAPFYGHKHSEEAKKKISDALSGENNYNYGKPLPLNVKKKISLNKNTSSYFRVSKHHDKRYKQGFIWQYSYYENNINFYITHIITYKNQYCHDVIKMNKDKIRTYDELNINEKEVLSVFRQ